MYAVQEEVLFDSVYKCVIVVYSRTSVIRTAIIRTLDYLNRR